MLPCQATLYPHGSTIVGGTGGSVTSSIPAPSGDWILATGFWDNTGVWDNTATWIN